MNMTKFKESPNVLLYTFLKKRGLKRPLNFYLLTNLISQPLQQGLLH
jgi:hypothetical protein